MKKYVCIHGHFYQPPRENPWLGTIERQESAYPYHDWNQRIDAECYTPNTAARVLDEAQFIVDVLNNYEYISFNFGPTLMQWLERNSPKTYEKIVAADTASVHRYGGHGNAIAQVYNHIIMPLATRKDKEIQVRWGIEDFRYHFHRDPEGMWLSETAVDIETLEVLADYGIKFTILSPYQAKRFRRLGEKDWVDVRGGIDGRFPYLCRLPGGKSIILFFYDGPVAQDIAFGGLLNSGEAFFQRLLSIANAPLIFDSIDALMVNIATDGETYGHHHKFAEMGLAYALKKIMDSPELEILNYAAFVERYPPFLEVEIHENTSWSCAHGVERWRSNCGCKIGAGNGSWDQQWRAPLREAVDFLRAETDRILNERLAVWVASPDELLARYVDVMLRPIDRDSWLVENVGDGLKQEEISEILRLLEAGKFSLFIFTSCAWFFDEISGIEPVQILTYAARCIELLESLGYEDIEDQFVRILAKAKSNIEEFGDGAWVYHNFAKVRRKSMEEIGAHFAICNLFMPKEEATSIIYNYWVDNEEFYRDAFNDYQISAGRMEVRSLVTLERRRFEYAVLYTGAHDVRCSLKGEFEDVVFDAFLSAVSDAFREHNLTELVRAMDNYLGKAYYGMDVVLTDDRQKILDFIVRDTLVHFEETFDSLFEAYQGFFQGLRSLNYSLPFGLTVVVQQVLNKRLKSLLQHRSLDDEVYSQIMALLGEIDMYGVSVEVGQIRGYLEAILGDLVERLARGVDKETLSSLLRLMEILNRIKIQVNLWEIQNVFIEYSKRQREKILPDLLVLWKDLANKIRVRV